MLRTSRSSSSSAPGLLAPSLAALAVLSAAASAQSSGLDAPMVGSCQSGPTPPAAAAAHWHPSTPTRMHRRDFDTGEDRRLELHNGMTAVAEVEIASQSFLRTIVPGLGSH